MIPCAPLLLGLAGTLPFIWGAITTALPDFALASAQMIGPRFVGPYVQLFYGAVILSFMSGVLWGFATKAAGRDAAGGYVLSVLPALWVFITTGGGPQNAALALIAGFVGLLALDWHFVRAGLAPGWWMPLRVILTFGVVLFLLPVLA